MVKITAVCSESPGAVEPSHGFGVLIDDAVLFDSCSREAMDAFLKASGARPVVGVVGMPDSPHHVGGFELLRVPLVNPPHDLELRVRGRRYLLFKGRRENFMVVDGVVVSPCGLSTVPYGEMSRRGSRRGASWEGLVALRRAPTSYTELWPSLGCWA
ncbi:hypothetical protein [Pyrobaculum calidifontis]|uniref:hypothetical protein n=1 Tax=Pyrobaculum calidifontis TaxID=181486 RepID=UPI001D028C77|nr:hypothetical protein [Pyrobaculum calidifontis]